MRYFKVVYLIFLANFFLLSGSAIAIEVFVSNNGADEHSGFFPIKKNNDGPVRSISKALQTIKAWNKKNNQAGGEVVIVDSNYYLEETVSLSQSDSGTKSQPLVFRGFNGFKSTIKGSSPVMFEDSQDYLTTKIKVAKVGTVNDIKQVFVNGSRVINARYPNQSDDYKKSWLFVQGAYIAKHLRSDYETSNRIKLNDSILKSLEVDDGLQVNIFPRWNWINNIVKVSSVDHGEGIINLAENTIYSIRPGDRFFIQNSYSLVDSEGEWFFDKKKSNIYIYSTKDGSFQASYSKLGNLFVGELVSNVEFRDLQFSEADGAAIFCNNCTNVKVENSYFSNLGSEKNNTGAIQFVGGGDNSIISNSINSVNGSGIVVQAGDIDNLLEGEVLVLNNDISNVGVLNSASAGISVSGVGNWVIANKVHDVPRFGVLMGGANNLVAYNKILNTNLSTEDTGAIYVNGRDGVSGRGCVLYKNIISNSVGFTTGEAGYFAREGASGIYLDDNSSEVYVIDNYVEKTSGPSLIVHNGSYNKVKGNHFRNGGGAMILLKTFSKSPGFYTVMQDRIKLLRANIKWRGYFGNSQIAGDMVGNRFDNNIIVSHRLDTTYIRESGLSAERNFIDENYIEFPNVKYLVQTDFPKKKLMTLEEWQGLGFDRSTKKLNAKVCAGVVGHRITEGFGCIRIGDGFIRDDKTYNNFLTNNWSAYRKDVIYENYGI